MQLYVVPVLLCYIFTSFVSWSIIKNTRQCERMNDLFLIFFYAKLHYEVREEAIHVIYATIVMRIKYATM